MLGVSNNSKRYFIINILIIIVLLYTTSGGVIHPTFAQADSCTKMYTFETGSSTPIWTIKEGWQIDDNPDASGKSFRSSRPAISKCALNVKGPADISFWWFSNRVDTSAQFLFQVDNEPNINLYNNSDKWEQIKTEVGEGRHILTWTFSKRPRDNDISGWIDDLCIKNDSCSEECPTKIIVATPPIKPTPPITTPVNHTPPTNNTNATNVTNVTNLSMQQPFQPCPLPIEITSASKVYYVLNGSDAPPILFPSIQSAINNVPAGSTICIINPGWPYSENVVVNKSLRLISNNFAVITPAKDNTGIHIVANDVIVSEIEIDGGKYGIQLDDVKRCNITHNKLKANRVGIILNMVEDSKINNNQFLKISRDAIRLFNSINNTFKDNNISRANTNGIYLERSEDNTFANNKFQDTYGDGIYVNLSDCNTFSENNFMGSRECDIFEYNSSNEPINIASRQEVCLHDPHGNCKCYSNG